MVPAERAGIVSRDSGTIGARCPSNQSRRDFDLPHPANADGDVVAVGGDFEAGTLLQAYRKGMFPMHLPDGHLGWWSPIERAILPLDGLRISRSLRQSCGRFQSVGRCGLRGGGQGLRRSQQARRVDHR